MKRWAAAGVATALLPASAILFTPVSPADEAPAVGTIMTVAGTGRLGASGDGGPAFQATFNGLHGIAFDVAGNYYLADYNNHRIRKVSTDGIVTTIAGTGKAGYTGDGGPAIAAQIGFPHDVAVDLAGNVYFADLFSRRVRKVSPDGIITTVAGNGRAGYTGDGGPATEAPFALPAGVGLDAQGNLYIADFGATPGDNQGRLRKVAPDGIITTLAGGGARDPANPFGDGRPGREARLNNPEGVTADAMGNLFISDLSNNRIRKLTPDGIIHTVAGNGPVGMGSGAFGGDGGPAIEAKFNFTHSVAVDAAGNLFIADMYNNRVRKVSPDGIVTTVAGSGPVRGEPGAARLAYSGEGGPATSARLVGPFRVAIDAAGNLYILDSTILGNGPANNERVLKVHGVAAPGLVAGRPFPR